MKKSLRIHFICRGNIFRSKIAEAYLKSLHLPNVSVISSGTVANRDPDTISDNLKSIFIEHKIKKYKKKRSNRLTQARIDKNDIIVCVNQRVFSEVKKIVKLPRKVIVWHIADIGEVRKPPKTDKQMHAFFEKSYDKITKKVDQLVTTLKKN